MKGGDRQTRRRCAVCKQFLATDRRSSYCPFHQSQRMIVRRGEQKLARHKAALAAWDEVMSPEERLRFEGWTYWAAIRDATRNAATSHDPALLDPAFNWLDYLMGGPASPRALSAAKDPS